MFATGQKRTGGCGHHYTAGRVHDGDATWSATPAGCCWPPRRATCSPTVQTVTAGPSTDLITSSQSPACRPKGVAMTGPLIQRDAVSRASAVQLSSLIGFLTSKGSQRVWLDQLRPNLTGAISIGRQQSGPR